MWLLSRVGSMELMFVFLSILLASCFKKRGLKWMAAVGPILVLGVLVSGPDLLSMLIVFGVLMVAFALGAYWGPRLLSTVDGDTSRDGGLA